MEQKGHEEKTLSLLHFKVKIANLILLSVISDKIIKYVPVKKSASLNDRI